MFDHQGKKVGPSDAVMKYLQLYGPPDEPIFQDPFVDMNDDANTSDYAFVSLTRLEDEFPDKNYWRCFFCPRSYHVYKKMQQHMSRQHKYRTLKKLTKTESKKTEPKPLSEVISISRVNTCHKCRQTFMDDTVLGYHMKVKHFKENDTFDVKSELQSFANGIFGCKKCNTTYKKRILMEKHIIVKHHPELLSFPCDHCKKAFYSCRYLLKHRRLVHFKVVKRTSSFGVTSTVFPIDLQEKKFTCLTCAKSFKSKYVLKRHRVNIHRESSPITMDINAGTASNDEKFKCQTCSIVLKSKLGLKIHMKAHRIAVSTSTPKTTQHDCEICGLVFKKRSQVKNHVKTVHQIVNLDKPNFDDNVLDDSIEVEINLANNLFLHDSTTTRDYNETRSNAEEMEDEVSAEQQSSEEVVNPAVYSTTHASLVCESIPQNVLDASDETPFMFGGDVMWNDDVYTGQDSSFNFAAGPLPIDFSQLEEPLDDAVMIITNH